MLAHGEREHEVGELGLGRHALRHHLEIALDHALVAALHEVTARKRTQHPAFVARVGHLAGQQQAQVLLFRKHGLCGLVGIGRDDHLGEDLGDLGGGGAVERAVERDDAAERADRIAGQRLVPRIGAGIRRGDAARVRVLDDDDRRPVELGHELIGRVGVVEIVVGKLLALHLRCRGDARAVRAVGVERGALVRILAIAQRLPPDAGQHEARRKFLAFHAREPLRDRGVVGAGARIGGGGEALLEREAHRAAVGRHFVHQRRIVRRVGDDGDEIVVLRGRADEGRPADVDVLDALLEARALRHGRFERVEIDHHEVDRLDAVLLHRLEVPGRVAPREDAAVDLRLQRLHAPIHHLGKAGVVRNLDHRHARIAERFGRAAGREDLHAARGEELAQLHEPRLVGDGDERAADRGGGGHGLKPDGS